MKFFKYFFEDNVFVWIFLVLAVLSAIYVMVFLHVSIHPVGSGAQNLGSSMSQDKPADSKEIKDVLKRKK